MTEIAACSTWEAIALTDDECGTIETGKCANILVVDGDPLADITILQNRSKLALVMPNGRIMVDTLGLPQELAPIPKEGWS